jgi:hypothetical protein
VQAVALDLEDITDGKLSDSHGRIVVPAVVQPREVAGLARNSLRYRLSRAEELAGRPLKDPATITSLSVAFGADANRGRT